MDLVLDATQQSNEEYEKYHWSGWTVSSLPNIFWEYDCQKNQELCQKCKVCEEVAIKVGTIIVCPCVGCAQKNGFVWGCPGYRCLGVDTDTKEPHSLHTLMKYYFNSEPEKRIAKSVKEAFKAYWEKEITFYEHQLKEGDQIQVFSVSANKEMTGTLKLNDREMMVTYQIENIDKYKPAPIKYWKGVAPNIYDQNKKLSLKIKQDIYGYMSILHDEFFNRTCMFRSTKRNADGTWILFQDQHEEIWMAFKSFLEEGPII